MVSLGLKLMIWYLIQSSPTLSDTCLLVKILGIFQYHRKFKHLS